MKYAILVGSICWPNQLYVSRFDASNQIVTKTTIYDLILWFKSPKEAHDWIKRFADRGYGLSSERCEVVSDCVVESR